MDATATNAPGNCLTPKQWLESQKDLIEDGNCGCRMTLKACLDRQAKYAHKALIGNGRENHHEITRHYFIPCVGNAGETACPHYTPRERDPQTAHTSFEVGQHRIGADTLETIHKRNQFNRAVRGISAKVGE